MVHNIGLWLLVVNLVVIVVSCVMLGTHWYGSQRETNTTIITAFLALTNASAIIIGENPFLPFTVSVTGFITLMGLGWLVHNIRWYRRDKRTTGGFYDKHLEAVERAFSGPNPADKYRFRVRANSQAFNRFAQSYRGIPATIQIDHSWAYVTVYRERYEAWNRGTPWQNR